MTSTDECSQHIGLCKTNTAEQRKETRHQKPHGKGYKATCFKMYRNSRWNTRHPVVRCGAWNMVIARWRFEPWRIANAPWKAFLSLLEVRAAASRNATHGASGNDKRIVCASAKEPENAFSNKFTLVTETNPKHRNRTPAALDTDRIGEGIQTVQSQVVEGFRGQPSQHVQETSESTLIIGPYWG